MFENIKNLIKSKSFELKDMLSKINIVWLESMITDEQMKELKELARQNAVAENSYAPLQEQINNTNTRIDKLEARIEALEKQETEEVTEPTEPEEPVEEGYPEYKQPAGAHDCYNIGDKITYNGKKYTCKINGCVWDPITYPDAWEKVVEENTDEVEQTVTNEEG